MCVLLVAATLACFFLIHDAVVEIARDSYGRELRGGVAPRITNHIAGILFIAGTLTVVPALGLMDRRRPGLILLGLSIALWSTLLIPSLSHYPYRFGFIYLLGLICIVGGVSLLGPALRLTSRHFGTHKTPES